MRSSALNYRAQLSEGRSGGGRILILADDLTGACDSGVAFLACGRRVRVVLDGPGAGPSALRQAAAQEDNEVWAFTTETRSLPPEEASERFTASVHALQPISRGTLIFKKIDSAARGHVGAEIVAALRFSGAELALVAPAFPKAGRTVESGVLSVRDCSGQDATISLRDLFPEVEERAIGVLAAASEEHLEQGIAEALANGVRILLCDASTQADLERLAACGLGMQRRLLWAGSAGLAYALAAAVPALAAKAASPVAHRHGRTLLFVGTEHPVTGLQVSHLEQSSGVQERGVHFVRWDELSERKIIAAFAAEPVAALVLTGGDTAALVLHSLEASSIALAGELAAGIPWGYIEGGAADGCVVVTKSGGFGSREALADAVEFCERRLCEPA